MPKHILSAIDETAKVGPIPKEMLAMAEFAINPEDEEIKKFDT